MKKLLTFTILATVLANCSSGIEEYNCIRTGDGAEITLTVNMKDNLWTYADTGSEKLDAASGNGFIKEQNTIHIILHEYIQESKKSIPQFFLNKKTKKFYFLPFDNPNVPITDLPLYDKDDEFLIANCK